MNITRLTCAAALAAIALAGCGGASSSSSSASSSSTSPAVTASTPASSASASSSSTSPAVTTGAPASSSTSSSDTSTTSASSTATGAPSAPASSAAGLTARFKAGYAVDQKQFRAVGSALGDDVLHAGSASDAKIASEFGKLAAEAGAVATRLAALHPPARYSADLHRLVTAFSAVASDLATISGAGVTHSATAAEAATRKLLVDSAAARAADNAISAGLGLAQARP